MDIKSPAILKLKGALFALLGCLSGFVLLFPNFSWTNLLLFVISIWAFCRCYYFCFYVMERYADPSFRYAGIWDLIKHLARGKPR